MITGFTILSAHKHGDVLRSTHKLRYKAFVQRMSYDVPVWAGMEYDKYDNLTTVYLSWQDSQGIVRGTCRLAPTDRDYMIRDLWPDSVTQIPLPHSPFVWEASRLCVDHHLSADERRGIISELVCAYQQVGLMYAMDFMIGVMPPNIWNHVFTRSGWEIEFIGPEIRLNTGEIIVAGKMNIAQRIMQSILTTTGLEQPTLEFSDDILTIAGNAVLREPAAFLKEHSHA